MDTLQPHAWDDPDFTEIRDAIIQIIATKLKVATQDIKATSHLVEDLGADSLDAAEIILVIEDQYQVVIDKATPPDATVGDIMNIVRTALTPPAEEA